jgi:DNA-binding protein H-NS
LPPEQINTYLIYIIIGESMASYQELLAQKEALEKQILEAKAREKSEGVAKAKAIIEQYNLSASDLFNRKGPAGSRGGKVAAKYRNPATGETWTGRGKAPKWIEGKNRAQFAI